MAASKRTRFEVFKRDKFTCQYCGRRPPEVVLQCDHIVPVAKGGVDDRENLTTACFACNIGKSDVPLENVAPALDELELLAGIQEMLERKVELERQTVVANATRQAVEEAVDIVQRWWGESFAGTRAVDVFERPSVRRFLNRITLDDLRVAVDQTEFYVGQKPWMPHESESRLWKYFCGVCWKMVRGQYDAKHPGTSNL